MFSDNLLYLRNLKGLSQEQVAEAVGISRQSYSKWEQGDTFPDIDKCDKLAKFYGVTIDSLMLYRNLVKFSLKFRCKVYPCTDFLLICSK